MKLVWGADLAVAEFVAAQFPLASRRGFALYAAVGIADDHDVLVGGIVGSDWRGHDLCLSIFATRPDFLRPEMIVEACAWCFRAKGLKRITAEIAKKNRRARKFVEHVGFRLEGTLRHGWHDGNDDMCIYGMTAETCRWLQ